MIEISLDVDTSSIDSALRSYAKNTGVPVNFIVKDQMRLLLQDMIKFSPPRKKKPGSKIDKNIGKERVEKDIGKVIVPVGPAKANTLYELFGSKGTVSEAAVFKTRRGAIYGVDRDLWKPTANRRMIKPHHEKYRRKDGRVTEARGGSEQGRNTKDVGRWKFVDKLHVRERAFRSYVKHRQKKVGELAAGWIHPLDEVARAVNTKGKAPVWVRKAEGLKGEWKPRMNEDGSGYVEATNPYGYSAEKYMRFLPSLMAKRRKDIVGQLWRRLDRLTDQFNAGKLGRAA